MILFSAAAAAVLYSLRDPPPVSPARRAPGRRFSPTRVPAARRPAKARRHRLTSGALLGATNLFDENGDAALGRILNDATFLGGFVLIAAIALIALGTATRWARNAYRPPAG